MTARLLGAAGLCCGLVAGGSALAQSDLRIAFVNAARIVESAPQAALARNRLEEEFAPRDRDLLRMQEDVRALEDRMNEEAALASEAERRRLERELLTQRRELKRAQDEFREDLNIRRNEEFARLQRQVADVITEMAREENYDLILNEAAVIYASDRVDATEQVLLRLRREQ